MPALGPLLLILAAASPSPAHQVPVPIALWGGFAPDAVRCQRVLSGAAAHCADMAWRLSSACSAAQMAGADCDSVATRAIINSAHAMALAVAERTCIGVDFSPLGFTSLLDIDVDVDTFCQQVENAMVSAVYSPVTRRGRIGPADDAIRACVTATTGVATRLLRLAFRERRRLLDRIAAVALGPQQKIALIKQSSTRILRMQALSDTRLRDLCPDFESRYGRASGVFLKLVAQRADCLAGRTYAQDGVTCPLPVCGNGMQEASEACDDGNLVNADGCDETCAVEDEP